MKMFVQEFCMQQTVSEVKVRCVNHGCHRNQQSEPAPEGNRVMEIYKANKVVGKQPISDHLIGGKNRDGENQCGTYYRVPDARI